MVVFFLLLLYEKFVPDISQYILETEKSRMKIRVITDYALYLKDRLKNLEKMKEEMEVLRISSEFDKLVMPIVSRESERREDLIRRLSYFVEKFPDTPVTPYTMLRLAELLYEKSSYEFMEKYENAIATGDEIPNKDFTPSLKVYEKFLQKFPKFERRDAVMYLAGYVLSEMGNIPEAVEKYFAPLAEVRTSPLCPEAALRTAEFYFDIGDLEKAEEYYKIVLDFPQSQFYSKAMYKLAWTYYRMGKYQLAFAVFSELLIIGGKRGREEAAEFFEFKNEALQFLISSIVELGGFYNLTTEQRQKALEVFSELGKNPEMLILLSSAELYSKQGKYFEAYQTYRSVVDKFYLEKESLFAQFGIIEALKKLGDFAGVIAAQVDLSQRWGPESEWARRNREEFGKNRVKMENLLLESSKYYHELFQKDGSEENKEKALKTYSLFLSLYPTSPQTAEVQYLVAEIYFSTGDFKKAYEFYRDTIENVYARNNKYVYDAAWGMVISADELLKREKSKEAAELLKEASQNFESLFPLDKKTPIALYKSARVLASEGDYKSAVKILEKIVSRYPGSEIVPDAIKEIAKVYVDFGELWKVVDWVVSQRKRSDILTADDISYLNDLGAKSLFKMAKDEEGKDWQRAVSLYSQIESLFPKSDIIDDALFNITTLYYNNKFYFDVITLADNFLRRFMNSEYSPYIIFEKAYSYEKVFMFDDALKTYDLLIKLDFASSKNIEEVKKLKRDAVYNSMRIYEGTGNWERAAEYSLRYYREYGSLEKSEGKKPEEYLLRAAYYLKNAGKIDEMRQVLFEYLSLKPPKDEEILIGYEIAKTYFDEGKKKEGEEEFMRIMKEWEKSTQDIKSKTISQYSEIRLYFSMKTVEEFEKVRFEKRDKTKDLKKKLETKANLAKKIVEEMTQIVSLGDPNWALAGLFYMGYVHQKFAESLINAPIPEEIEKIPDEMEREEAKAIYQEELQKEAFPLEDKAKEIYQRALAKAREIGIRNSWTELIQKNLKILDPLAPVEIEDIKYAIAEVPFEISQKTPKEIKRNFRVKKEYNLVNPNELRQYVFEEMFSYHFSPKFIWMENGKTFFIE